MSLLSTTLRPMARFGLPAILGFAGLAGCGARPAPQQETPKQVVEMDSMVIEYQGEQDGKSVTVAFDDAALFTEAKGYFDGQKFEEAQASYGKLLKYFPKSSYVHAALYNRGLCFEHLKQYGEAANHFRRYIQLSKSLEDQRDGEFRWGYNLIKTEDWPTALDLYNRLLKDPQGLGEADLAEAYLRRATALTAMDQFGESERDLKKSMRLIEKAYSGVTEGNPLYAEAHFRRGQIYETLFRKVQLKLPAEQMKVDLQDKVRFFRQSQSSYLDALNVREPFWATAAGFKLGELYEVFYMHILQSEVPDEFDDETRRFYFVELKRKLRPLMEQALTIYEKNISMSQRVGTENEWVSETDARMARLRDLLEASLKEEKAMEEEERAYEEAQKARKSKKGKGKPQASRVDLNAAPVASRGLTPRDMLSPRRAVAHQPAGRPGSISSRAGE
ncbi:MAG: tetratricopeptide repeat protein [Bradymonadia bacterium]